jgi:hypothetical protein
VQNKFSIGQAWRCGDASADALRQLAENWLLGAALAVVADSAVP